MKTSVVLAAYNGAIFIREQLDSIFQQSTSIGELIIVDDHSTDGTSEIIKEYAANYSKITLITNEQNEGVVSSFEKGIKAASGDIIFLCDQDDLWKINKVEVFIEYFMEHNLLIVFSDAQLINADGESLEKTFMDKLGVPVESKSLILDGKIDKVLMKGNIVSGATMAFRKEIIDYNILPLITEEKHMLHDRFIAGVIAAQFPERVLFIDECLSDYRVHENQFMGFNEKDAVSMTRSEYFEYEARLLEYILDRAENQHFRRAHYFWYMRSKLINNAFLQRFISANTLLLEGDYKRYCDNPYREMIADVLGRN